MFVSVGVSGSSLEPRSEEAFDIPAAPRVRQPPLGPLVRDDDEGGNRLDLEPLDEVAVGVGVDSQELERFVVRAPL